MLTTTRQLARHILQDPARLIWAYNLKEAMPYASPATRSNTIRRLAEAGLLERAAAPEVRLGDERGTARYYRLRPGCQELLELLLEADSEPRFNEVP
jgi:DNA-binding HxlR family transcriptional regulator